MKQYWFFALNCLCNVVFCAVDGAFGNGISIDAIVVMGSFSIIENVCVQLITIGAKAYKVFQRYEKNCGLLSLLMGVVIGAICITCAYYITFIFDLTDIQREMLRQALICYGIWCPIEAVGRFMLAYVTYKCYNRLLIISNFLTYILLIVTDWIAVRMGWGVNGLISSTGNVWLVYAVILIISTKFFNGDDKVTLSVLKTAFTKGKDVMLGGIASRVANLCLGHFASTMGTEQYAIHSVALSVVSLAEEFRDAEADYVIVRLKNRDKHKGDKARRLLKQCWLPSLLLPIAASVVLAFVMHGKVSIADTLYGVSIYCMPMLLYPMYDLVQQFTISKGKTKYNAISGCICALWRIGVICIVSLMTPISIWILGLIYLFDYGSRMSYYILMARRDSKRELKSP